MKRVLLSLLLVLLLLAGGIIPVGVANAKTVVAHSDGLVVMNKEAVHKNAPKLAVGEEYTIKLDSLSTRAGYFKIEPSKSGSIKISISNYKSNVKEGNHMYQNAKFKIMDDMFEVCKIDVENEDCALKMYNSAKVYSKKGRKSGAKIHPSMKSYYAAKNAFTVDVKAGNTYYLYYNPECGKDLDRKLVATCDISIKEV